MNTEEIKNKEYTKSIDILAALIELDDEEKEKVRNYFQSMGIKSFFQQVDALGLSPITIEKLRNVRSIVEMPVGKRGL